LLHDEQASVADLALAAGLPKAWSISTPPASTSIQAFDGDEKEEKAGVSYCEVIHCKK